MNKRFSERKYLKGKKVEIIKESLNQEMKNRLWNDFLQTI